MLHMAGSVVVRYIGTDTKKLWEAGARNVPIINEGDLVILDAITAATLCRNRFFEKVEDAQVSVTTPDQENPPADFEEHLGLDELDKTQDSKENEKELELPQDSKENEKELELPQDSKENEKELEQTQDSKEEVSQKKKGK